MSKGLRELCLALITLMVVIFPTRTKADFNITGNFSANGDVGFVTSPANLTIGFGADSTGSIYQMDGYLNIPGQNSGTSYDLGYGGPTGIGYAFAASQPTANQLMLSYTFTNNTTATLAGFQFLYYVDPDIATAYLNTATVNGSVPATNGPTTFQAGDDQYSSIVFNTMQGTLNNQNTVTTSTPGDAAIALGFGVGPLAVGQSATVDILLSDNLTSIGNFSITQRDAASDPNFSSDTLTVSGYLVPEPSSLVLMAIGFGSSLVYSVRRPRRQA